MVLLGISESVFALSVRYWLELNIAELDIAYRMALIFSFVMHIVEFLSFTYFIYISFFSFTCFFVYILFGAVTWRSSLYCPLPNCYIHRVCVPL